MALATWWHGDSVPDLSPLMGFHVEVAHDAHLIAQINRLALDEVRQRMHTGHQPYLAYIEQAPVGYGWVAAQEASIGELGLRFALPETDRYLWDFATLPDWQGYGIYPRLLQGILAQQLPTVARLWIIHAPENSPSGVGMTKAGLLPIGQLSFRSDGGVGLAPFDAPERAQAGAALLGIPLIESVLAPCWSCGAATHTHMTVSAAESCWPPLQTTLQHCTCAIELKPAKTLVA
jgi:GNAT superfamily N-acetyltransferase